MLTYSFSLNEPVTIAPLKKIVLAEIVYILWHANFRLSERNICLNADGEYDKEKMILINTQRDETIFASHTFVEENNLPRIFETFFKNSIFSLYQAYNEMLLWRGTYDADCYFQLLDKNKLYAPKYFTVYGEFNDLAWSKGIVLDPNYPLVSRFYLSCEYWFENESAMLWSELKKSDRVPFNGSLSLIQEEMNEIITIRIFQLENKLEILAQNPKYAGNLYKVGFEKAVLYGCEYALYYFWQNLTEQQKINISGTDTFMNLFNIYGIRYPPNKIKYFLYSQLSKEQRKKFFLDEIIEYDYIYPLVALLLSPYAEKERSELIGFAYELPIHLYSEILDKIARDLIREDGISSPLHSEVFEVLWNNLSFQERDKVLKNPVFSEVQRLIKAKSYIIIIYNLHV